MFGGNQAESRPRVFTYIMTSLDRASWATCGIWDLFLARNARCPLRLCVRKFLRYIDGWASARSPSFMAVFATVERGDVDGGVVVYIDVEEELYSVCVRQRGSIARPITQFGQLDSTDGRMVPFSDYSRDIGSPTGVTDNSAVSFPVVLSRRCPRSQCRRITQ